MRRCETSFPTLSVAIEGGSTFSEGLAQHPKVFNRLYVNMVKAGELGGVLEVVLNRLSEFMEKAQKIKGKVVAAMFYPAAVMTVAVAILGVLMIFVVPKFQAIFADLLGGEDMPGFTMFVLKISNTVKDYTIMSVDWAPVPVPGPVIWVVVAFVIVFKLLLKTKLGRKLFDKLKAQFPGPRAGHQQGRYFPVHPHAGHAREQRRADSAGPDDREGDLRQRHHW